MVRKSADNYRIGEYSRISYRQTWKCTDTICDNYRQGLWVADTITDIADSCEYRIFNSPTLICLSHRGWEIHGVADLLLFPGLSSYLGTPFCPQEKVTGLDNTISIDPSCFIDCADAGDYVVDFTITTTVNWCSQILTKVLLVFGGLLTVYSTIGIVVRGNWSSLTMLRARDERFCGYIFQSDTSFRFVERLRNSTNGML
jgi:hypothetical protein